MAAFEMFELGETSAVLPPLPEYKEGASQGSTAPDGQVRARKKEKRKKGKKKEIREKDRKDIRRITDIHQSVGRIADNRNLPDVRWVSAIRWLFDV